MSKIIIDTIKPDIFYLIDKEVDILVSGHEIKSQVINARWHGDTITLIQPKLYYRLAEQDSSVWLGQKIISTLPTIEFHALMGWGTFFFGVVLGWNLYFINRYRKRDSIGLGDLATIIAALAGAVIIHFLNSNGQLIGFYGIGLAIGFFMYLMFLIMLSKKSGTSEYKFPDFFLKIHDSQQTNYTDNEE